MADAGEIQSALPRRLNGRLAACDPCRARKVACDHTRPICNRCRRRADGTECVYSGQEPRPRSSKPPRRVPEATRPRIEQRISDSIARDTPPSYQRSNLVAEINPGPSHRRGYLGVTSYNAIFEEARNSLSLLNASDLNHSQDDLEAEEDLTSFQDMPLPSRVMCLYVLQSLPDQLCEPDGRPEGFPYAAHDWYDIAMDRIIDSLQALLTQAREQGDKGFENLAEKICRNSTRSLREDVPTLEEWLVQFCDANLRWESIGLVWAYASTALSDVVHSSYCQRNDWLSSRCSPDTARICLSYCIDLSCRISEFNVLSLEITRRHTTLESTIVGETKHASLASMGVGSTMMIYLGLHAQPNVASYQPTRHSENRRRLFTQIFISDKLGVTFTGRPPRLSRRYCTTPLPLDLSDEELASDQDSLIRAFELLDEHGWNTKGGLYPATVMRARAMIAYIRDELVEIALSHNVVVTVEHLQNLENHQHEIYSNFPKSLIYHPKELNDPSNEIRRVFLQILVYLEYLKNIFYAQRLLLLNGQPNGGNLLITSFVMLTTVLVLWTHRERFSWPSIQRNFQWHILAFGGPAAGVLCLELLRPSFSRIHPKDPSISRSSIVQQMSLFVGSLDWVDPSAPDSDLCHDCKIVVQRVLDYALNSSLEVSNVSLDPMDWGLGSLPDFDFELPDTFDWMQSDAQ